MAVVTVAAYLALLGWHHLQDYEGWKVWTLIGLLAALAVWYGWRADPGAGTLTQAATLTLLWSFDAATDPGVEEPNLWPVGAMFVLVGTAVGAAVVSVLADGLRRRVDNRNR